MVSRVKKVNGLGFPDSELANNDKYINVRHTESVGLQLFDIFHSSEDGKAVFQVDGGNFRLKTSDMESFRYYLCASHAVAG